MRDSISALRRTFGLFCAAQFGVWPSWQGPDHHADLTARVVSLGILMRIIPPGKTEALGQIATFLAARFPDDRVIPTIQLRDAAMEAFGWDVPNRPPAGARSLIRRTAYQPGLHRWIQQLRTSQDWTRLPTSVPGTMPCLVQRDYVPRSFANAADDADVASSPNHQGPNHQGPNHQGLNRHAMGIESVLLRSGGRCLITAQPGGGKTALVRWLVQQIVHGKFASFRMPIVIDGAGYGQALRGEPNLTPLEHFFGMFISTSAEARSAAAAFRNLSPAESQALFLVDNADAVPRSVRARFFDHLSRDAEGQPILMTARSMLSSCLPALGATCYRLMPLADGQIGLLVRRVLDMNYPAVTPEFVVDRLVAEPDFRPLASNPHWLTMLTIALAAMHRSKAVFCPADVLEQVVTWQRDRDWQDHPDRTRSGVQYTRVIARLAFECSEAAGQPQGGHDFSRDQCQRVAADCGIEADKILQSPFFTQPEDLLGHYRFVGRIFQRHFASCYLADMLTPNQQQRYFHDAMVNEEKLDVATNALHRSHSLRGRCRDWLSKWDFPDDCFGQMTYRTTRIVIAARCDRRDLNGPVAELCEKLWAALRQNMSDTGSRRILNQLFQVDRDYLARKLNQLRRHDAGLFESLVELDCPEVSGAFGGYAKSRGHRHTGRYESDESSLVRDIEPSLIQIFALPVDHPHIAKHLLQIVGRPIAGQHPVLLQIALSPRIDTETKILAIDTLAGCDATCDLTPLAKQVDVDTDPLVLAAVVRLGSLHFLPIDRQLLEKQIGSTTDSEQRRLCLQAYMKAWTDQNGPEVRDFLSRLACRGYERADVDLLRSIWDSVNHFGHSSTGRYFDARVDASATEQLLAFSRAADNCDLNKRDLNDFDLEVVGMAARWLSNRWLSNRWDDRDLIHLRSAMESALSLTVSAGSKAAKLSYGKLAGVLASSIKARDPSVMMGDLWDQPIVQETFAQAAWSEHWLVYRDRIVSDAGCTIARLSEDPLAEVRFSTPDVVQEISERLSPRQRDDFMSFWFMISEGGEDFARSDRKTVYDAICTILDSELTTRLSERLLMCYPDGQPPKFVTWKKNLVRVVHRCSSNRQWQAHLEKIGLKPNRNP